MSSPLGICGDACWACPRFRATEADDEEELLRLSRLWVRLGFRDEPVSPDEMRCSGCERSTRCAYPEQRACARSRGEATCGTCPEFPCPLAERAFEGTSALIERLRSRCSPEEFAELELAFGRKREHLEAARGGSRG